MERSQNVAQSSTGLQASKEALAWDSDLIKLGYKAPLPAPIPGVQAILSAINPQEVHEFVQTSDLAALESAGDEGESPLLLLMVLDLSQWIRIFEVANTDIEKAKERLQELHNCMNDIMIRDDLELDTTKCNTAMVEVAIRHANDQAVETVPVSQIEVAEPGVLSHPFLANLNIEEAHKAALEDFQESIVTTQLEKEQASLVASGKQLCVPFIPQRTIEDLVTAKDHRVWSIGNINSLAPILPSTWRIWAGISSEEMDQCKEFALHSKQFIANGHDLVNAFPLYTYDHSKCTIANVKLHCKVDVPTAFDRREKHPHEMWNVHRPYLRCACHPKSNNGCQGSFIWWDHACWYMINHLNKFFSNESFPTLKAKFVAFMIWMGGAGRMAIKCQITFAQSRSWMCAGAVQFAANPSGKILTDIPDGPGLRKIERMLKPASFTVANPGNVPNLAPPPKRQRINLNTSPNPAPAGRGNQNGRGRGNFGRGRGVGRGNPNINKRYSSPQQLASPFQYFPAPPRNERFQVFSHTGSDNVHGSRQMRGQQSSSVDITELPKSPLKGRILSFDDEI